MAGIGGYAALGGVLVWTGVVIGMLLPLIGLLIGRSQPVLWGVGIMGATYIGSLYLRGQAFDPWSLLVAMALLTSSELAHWSIDSRVPALDEVRVHLHRAWSISIVIAIALAVATLIEAAAAVGPGGTAAAAVAIGATLLGFIVLALTIWRGRMAGIDSDRAV